MGIFIRRGNSTWEAVVLSDDIGEREAEIYQQMLQLIKWGILAVLVAAGTLQSGVLGI